MINFNSKKFIFLSFFSLFLLFISSSFLYFSLFPEKQFLNTSKYPSADKYNYNQDNNKLINNNAEKNNKPQMDLFVSRSSELGDLITSPILDSDDPVIGNGKLVVVEFFDYDCEFCRENHKVINKLINDKYKNKVKLIVKNLPMKDRSSLSWKSAIASRCAYIQDKFILYNDYLLNTSEKFSDELFIKIAEKSNLNLKTFKSCYENQDTSYLLDNNIEEASSLNIYGIPFYYIGSQEIMGDLDVETLEKIISIELDK